MSNPTPHDSGMPTPTPTWRVREARRDDVPDIANAVATLLEELDGTSISSSTLPADHRLGPMEDTVRALLGDPEAGALFVADAEGSLVGLLASSWQMAIHAPGSYALIQDLWVHQAWRGRGVGRALIAELLDLADGRGVTRLEVGLPLESFARFDATEAFYLSNGFTPNGPRMRRLLS
jgi:GNAT superfamily N-acetyltransferase